MLKFMIYYLHKDLVIRIYFLVRRNKKNFLKFLLDRKDLVA